MAAPRTIGVLTPLLGWNFFGTLIDGIARSARARDIQLLIVQSHAVYGEAAERVPDPTLALAQVDGWIVVWNALSYDQIARLAASGPPLVTITRVVEGLARPAVVIDNASGTRAALEHLLGHGHRRIAFVGCLRFDDVKLRYATFRAVLAQHGIAEDAAPVIDIDNNLELDGRVAGQRLLDAGVPCSAVFAATDLNAFGLITVLQEAGVSVPEDVAVVSFDDVPAAQFFSPPLTTAHVQFDQLGRAALELLADELRGAPVRPGVHYVPAQLVLRRSCGCTATQTKLADEGRQRRTVKDLATLLVDQLSSIASGPQAQPQQPWPGATTLAQAVLSASHDMPTPSRERIAAAWHEALRQTMSLELVYELLRTLEMAGRAQLSPIPTTVQREALANVLKTCTIELMRAISGTVAVRNNVLDSLMRSNYLASIDLFGGEAGTAQQLGWLERMWVHWGALLLWSHQPDDPPETLVVLSSYSRTTAAPLQPGARFQAAHFPPADIIPEAGAGSAVKLVPVRTANRDWGVLIVSGPLDSQLNADDRNLSICAGMLSVALERDMLVRSLADQQELLRMAYEHQLITANTRDLICILDREGCCLYTSPACESLLGYQAAQLLGRSLFDLLHPDEHEPVLARWRELATGRQVQVIFRLQHDDGGWRWFEASGTLVAAAPASWRPAVLRSRSAEELPPAPAVVMICRDITERQQLQAQLLQAQKLDSIGRLAGGIAHDFNNLLTVMLGYVNFALELLAPEDLIRNDLLEVRHAGERAADLTRHLLAFARKQLIEPRMVNLTEVVQGMERLLRRLLGDAHTLTCELSAALWSVWVDPSQLEQVLMNLVANARDALDATGAVTIKTANVVLSQPLTAEQPIPAGRYVLLTVSDTGCGIDPAIRQHVFEPFFTTKPPGKGTGLGLATSYGIIRQHSGYIALESTPGVGTTFSIYLPSVDAPADTSAVHTLEELPRGTELALVVEDEAAVRAYIVRILRRLGYTVLEASNGIEALQLVQRERPPLDLLLTDVVMPGLGGHALVDQLRQERPQLATLYMSGYVEEAIIHQSLFDAQPTVLRKPFSAQELARKVREVLDAQQPESNEEPDGLD